MYECFPKAGGFYYITRRPVRLVARNRAPLCGGFGECGDHRISRGTYGSPRVVFLVGWTVPGEPNPRLVCEDAGPAASRPQVEQNDIPSAQRAVASGVGLIMWLRRVGSEGDDRRVI